MNEYCGRRGAAPVVSGRQACAFAALTPLHNAAPSGGSGTRCRRRRPCVLASELRAQALSRRSPGATGNVAKFARSGFAHYSHPIHKAQPTMYACCLPWG